MGLFSKCVVCGKTKLSFNVNRGVCSECYAKMMAEESDEKEDIFDVSDFVQPAATGYTLPPAPTDEPVYVIIDVETTGLDPNKDAIVQISALRFFGQKTIDGLNSCVNPCRHIPGEATAIHGISDETVKDAPTIDEIKEPFLNLIKDAILVGHNITFDLNFLDRAFHGALDGIKYIDTMWLAKTLLTLPNYRLETVADYAEFYPEGGYHDSLNDCTATAAVFFRLSFDKPGFAKTYRTRSPAKTLKPYIQHVPEPAVVPASRSRTLCGKKIVFAGKLSVSRREAAQMAADVGAIIRSTLSGKTDYLVLGEGDTSSQEDKADELFLEGNTSLEVISEQEFMMLLQESRNA